MAKLALLTLSLIGLRVAVMVRQNTQSCSSTSLSRNNRCTSSTGQGSVSAEWLRLPNRRAMNRCSSPGLRSSMNVSLSTFTVIGMTAMLFRSRKDCDRSQAASIAKPIRIMSPPP